MGAVPAKLMACNYPGAFTCCLHLEITGWKSPLLPPGRLANSFLLTLFLSLSFVSTSHGSSFLFEARLVTAHPHEQSCCTGGLHSFQGELYETCAQQTFSLLRTASIESGITKALTAVTTLDRYTAAGLTLMNDSLTVLISSSDNSRLKFYDTNLSKQDGISPPLSLLEGKGLSYIEENGTFVISNGTSTLFVVSSENYSVMSTTVVKVNGTASQAKFTSLAYANGFVWAIWWRSRKIVQIDVSTGDIVGEVDVTNLLSSSEFEVAGDNLSGIAYFSSSKHLCRSFNNNQFGPFFITGRYWPWIFEVYFVRAGAAYDPFCKTMHSSNYILLHRQQGSSLFYANVLYLCLLAVAIASCSSFLTQKKIESKEAIFQKICRKEQESDDLESSDVQGSPRGET